MVIYRIYTERKKVKQVFQIVSEYFNGYTIYETTGMWGGKKEKSMVIETILADSYPESRIKQLCQKIKGLCRQQEVWYTSQKIVLEVVR